MFFILLLLLSRDLRAEDTCGSLLIEKMSGQVISRQPEGDLELAEGDTVEAGESLSTGPASWANLRLCDGSTQRLGEKTTFTFEEAASETSPWSFSVLGTLRALVIGEEKGEEVRFRVKTPTAALGVRGTEFAVEAGEEETNLYTFKGEVVLAPAKDWAALKGTWANRKREWASVRESFQGRMKAGAIQPEAPLRFNPEQFRKRHPVLADFLVGNRGFRELRPGKRNRPIFRNIQKPMQKNIQRRMEEKRSQPPANRASRRRAR